MSNEELVKYRFSRAKESYDESILLASGDHWNAAANRLYYACFYLVNALLIQHDLSFTSHNGVKTEFHRFFVKTDKITIKSGKLYSRLFNLRQEGDYVDKRFYA
ncbi:MAG: HEPN domain-containing protein [Acidobacteria bacterium]|nr:HEPN domain-containing protein [Acidobacteriota bacterium]